MLHKSFKPAKCKTSLKLATSRIKLMKNKKGVQINQMKRDLAQLIETGQDRTARIRVEHVIREEKMVAAYELIEIYCELIVARLPIIESQKTCPIDLKEAVTSVIFAAPRCSDISELSDIRKQFAAKYGKDFVTAALELRPDCGVSRMLIEKLSAVAPDIQTKVKVLTAVAKEHTIEWDPTSFEEKESKPANDLLNGPPSIIENANKANVDPPKVQPSNMNVVNNREEKPNARFDYSEQNRKYTSGTQNVTSNDNGGETSSSSGATQYADTRSSGETSERMETRQKWNMEFKDATAAAQAAAESAERAAMAARAAAQFSSREKMSSQHPHVSNVRDETPRVSATLGSVDRGEQAAAESAERAAMAARTAAQYRETMNQHPHVANIRDETPRVSATSGSVGEVGYMDSYESYSDDRNPKTVHKSDQGNTRSSGPTSFRSDADSVKDEKLINNVDMADGYFEESLHEYQEGFRESDNEFSKESYEYENMNFFADEGTKKQPSVHSSSSDDELDVGKKSVVGNPFAVVDQGSPFKEATKTSSIVDVPRDRDDDAFSDDDHNDEDDDGGPKFDTGFEYDELETTNSLDNSHIWSPRKNTVDQPSSQSHLFSESLSFGEHSVKSMEPSEAGDHFTASFDHSDGPDSESESELPVQSSYDSRKTRIELNDLVEEEPPSFYNPEDKEKKPQSQHNFDQETYDTFEEHNDLDSRKELNFGTLTGGLRNKGGLKYPPYTKTATTDAESSVTASQTFLKSSLDSRVSKMEDKKPSIFSENSDSDSEKSSKKDSTRARFRVPDAFFNDDGLESEEEVPKQVPSRVRLGSGLSRRTRGSPRVSNSKSRVEPEPKTVGPTPNSGDEIPVEPRAYAMRFKEEDVKQIPESQQSSYISSRKTAETGRNKSTAFEIPAEPQTYATRFKEDVKQIPESQQPSYSSSRKTTETGRNKSSAFEPRVKHSVSTKQETVETIIPEPKMPTREPSPIRIPVESGNAKNAKTPNLGSESLSGENKVKKPSHVHPKLPDYDSLAARLQSMRTDQQ